MFGMSPTFDQGMQPQAVQSGGGLWRILLSNPQQAGSLTAFNFYIPADGTYVITAVGGGGSGAACVNVADFSLSGGASGALSRKTAKLKAGDTLSCALGKGGAPAVMTVNGGSTVGNPGTGTTVYSSEGSVGIVAGGGAAGGGGNSGGGGPGGGSINISGSSSSVGGRGNDGGGSAGGLGGNVAVSGSVRMGGGAGAPGLPDAKGADGTRGLIGNLSGGLFGDNANFGAGSGAVCNSRSDNTGVAYSGGGGDGFIIVEKIA